jgi:hypothetical protein
MLKANYSVPSTITTIACILLLTAVTVFPAPQIRELLARALQPASTTAPGAA